MYQFFIRLFNYPIGMFKLQDFGLIVAAFMLIKTAYKMHQQDKREYEQEQKSVPDANQVREDGNEAA